METIPEAIPEVNLPDWIKASAPSAPAAPIAESEPKPKPSLVEGKTGRTRTSSGGRKTCGSHAGLVETIDPKSGAHFGGGLGESCGPAITFDPGGRNSAGHGSNVSGGSTGFRHR
jgi:hypothetical protein